MQAPVHPYTGGIETANRERHRSPPRGAEREKNGYLLVSRGSTTAYCLEELLGRRSRNTATPWGRPSGASSARSQAEDRLKPYTFHKGEVLP